MWRERDITQACAGALLSRARASDEEQSPYGVDSLRELEIQAILRQGLATASFGVHGEVRLPRRAALPKRSEGERCDIVLTHEHGVPLIDPHDAATLFAGSGVPASDAFWIEVKCVHQFALVDGVARPSNAYSSQLLSAAVNDLRKLAAQGLPLTAALLVMFGADEATLSHDLTMWAHRCLDLGLPISAPVAEGFPITDRIGNAWCTVALTRVSAIEE